MTARQRRIYWNRERNKAVKYINKYKGRFYRALQSDIKDFQDALEIGEMFARRFVNRLLFSDAISGTLNQLIREVGVKYARDNYNTLRKEKLGSVVSNRHGARAGHITQKSGRRCHTVKFVDLIARHHKDI